MEVKIKVSWYIKVCCKEEKNNHCFFVYYRWVRRNGLKFSKKE